MMAELCTGTLFEGWMQDKGSICLFIQYRLQLFCFYSLNCSDRLFKSKVKLSWITWGLEKMPIYGSLCCVKVGLCKERCI